MADDTPGVSLVVPDFFSDAETQEALAIVREAIDADVRDSGLRKLLASGDGLLPIHTALQFIGDVGMDVLKDLTAAGILAACDGLRKRFHGRQVSLEITAQNEAGRAEQYWLEGMSDDALHAIPNDLERPARGPRVEYDVGEGWLTWEESQAKKRRPKQ